MHHFKVYLFFWVLIILFGCKNNSERRVNRGFYYWKTVLSISEDEKNYLKTLQINKLYLRLGDLEWSTTHQRAILKNTIIFRDSIPTFLEVCPTIFIVNEMLDSIQEQDIEATANYIHNAVIGLLKTKTNTLQIDCDWNKKTQNKYFKLLQALKNRCPWALSATIRLHQIKFKQKTGVPPVSQGLLMCYNMSNPRLFNPTNSIIDLKLVDSYTKNLEQYPIQLDIGLPLFSWVAVFRNKKFKRLVTARKTTLEKNMDFENLSESLFRAKRNTQIANVPIFENDILRADDVEINILKKVSTLLNSRLKNKSNNILLFHFDPKTIENYENQDVQNLYRLFD